MTESWIIQDIEKNIANRKRVVIIDPNGICGFLLPQIEKKNYIILKTESNKTEEWQRVKEELLLRFEAESKYKHEKVIFYVTRPKDKLSFLFDYCFTHGCVDLTNPVEWLRNKLFKSTGLQITLDNPMMITAAKLGIGKDIAWWKKIVQNLEDPISIQDELIPFLCDPDSYVKEKDSDVRRLIEEKIFDLIGQTHRQISAKSLAKEVVYHLFKQLLNNDVSPQMLSMYYRWLDSNTYSRNISHYADTYPIDPQTNIWNVHPDHCFAAIDKKQLQEITANGRNRSFIADKFPIVHQRLQSRKARQFVPLWWQDIITLFEFDNKPLGHCNTFEKVSSFYTSEFYKVDRAIRNMYEAFLHEVDIVRPIQEHYESLNHELLQHWFDCCHQYQSNQQGYLHTLIAQAKPGTAIIVGDGVRYEIAGFIASHLQQKCTVDLQMMYANMPSETEHNMSALYVGNNKVVAIHKDREKILSEQTGKEITFLNVEDIHHGIKADYLVLTYKDIDSTGEKLQMGALKLFKELEEKLIEKIELLLEIGYHQVHVVTDHGFVLTGLLNESDKIEPSVKGKKEVHERFIRTSEQQNDKNLLAFERTHGEFNYVYVAKSHRPFKSKGVYGFSHGGFTPQEIIIPHIVISKIQTVAPDPLRVTILKKEELKGVTGEIFGLTIQGHTNDDTLFSSHRQIQILLYDNKTVFSRSNILTIGLGSTISVDFSFNGHNDILAVIVDANTAEQIDSVKITKSNARDFGGLI
jgi:hypothetical protein